PAAVKRFERGCPVDNVQARPLLRPGFGEHDRSLREVEGSELHLRLQRCLRFALLQTPRDHQMQHEIQLVFQLEYDALADAMKSPHSLAEAGAQRRRVRAQQKRTL